jgi:excisionase family DNA binding protein
MFDEKFIAALAAALAPAVAARMQAGQNGAGGAVAPRYLNLEQAAIYLSTTPDGVRGMLRAKRFPARQMGKRVFIDRNDIDRAMEEGEHWMN